MRMWYVVGHYNDTPLVDPSGHYIGWFEAESPEAAIRGARLEAHDSLVVICAIDENGNIHEPN